MRDDVFTFSSKHGKEMDVDAESLRMNRSQFIDFVYNFWKDTQSRTRRVRLTINLVILSLLVMIFLIVLVK